MFPAAMRLPHIKDLKDLSFLGRGYYRHAGPKGPEEVFSHERSRGTGPRPTVRKNVPITVGRGPVPRHASVEENGVGWRAFFARVERSRGTGPRATGQEGVLLAMRRSGSGDPELRSLAPILLIVIILLISGES